MAKIKHSKYRNVGLLFEILTRKVTSEMLNRKQPVALSVLKKHFKNDSKCELTKAVKLYNAICNETVTHNKAESLIALVENLWSKLDHQALKQQTYSLVKEIKARYNDKEFFQTRVPHYTKLASTYQVLTYAPNDNPSEFLSLREGLIQQMTQNVGQSSTTMQEWASHDKQTRSLALKQALHKFNDRYKNLNENQRNLLAAFISQDTSASSFRDYIYSEVNKVVPKLVETKRRLKDTALAIKLEQAISLCENIVASNVIKDSHLTALMKYYELVEVLKDE